MSLCSAASAVSPVTFLVSAVRVRLGHSDVTVGSTASVCPQPEAHLAHLPVCARFLGLPRQHSRALLGIALVVFLKKIVPGSKQTCSARTTVQLGCGFGVNWKLLSLACQQRHGIVRK